MRSWIVTTPATPDGSSPSGSSFERPWKRRIRPRGGPDDAAGPPERRQRATEQRPRPAHPEAVVGDIERERPRTRGVPEADVLRPVPVQDAQHVARVVPEPGRVVEDALRVEADVHAGRLVAAATCTPRGRGGASGLDRAAGGRYDARHGRSPRAAAAAAADRARARPHAAPRAVATRARRGPDRPTAKLALGALAAAAIVGGLVWWGLAPRSASLEDAFGPSGQVLEPITPRADVRTGEQVAPFSGFAVSVDTEPSGAVVTVAGVPRGEAPVLVGVECTPGATVEIAAEKGGFAVAPRARPAARTRS